MRRQLLIYLGGLFGLFCLSYLYYYQFQNSLFHLIYGSTVQRVIKTNSDIKLAGFVLLGLTTLLIFNKLKNLKLIKKLLKFDTKLLLILSATLLMVVFSLSSIYTKKAQMYEANISELERNWYTYINTSDFIKHVPLHTIVIYVTPIGFLLYLATSFYYISKRKNLHAILLTIFTLWFLVLNVAFIPNIRYHYYNTRYLFSESVPYMLLLVAVFLGDLLEKHKKAAIVSTALIILFCLPFTLVQLYGPEMGHLDFYNKITAKVKPTDLLLIYKDHTQKKPQKYVDNYTTFAFGPLKYYYDLNTFILDKPEDIYAQPVLDLIGKYKKVYLISDKSYKNLDIAAIQQTTQKVWYEDDVKMAKSIMVNYSYGNWAFTNTEEQIRHRYSYYNTAPGCTTHTYEFLPLENVVGIGLPDKIKCIVPPTHYFTRYKDFYFYEYK